MHKIKHPVCSDNCSFQGPLPCAVLSTIFVQISSSSLTCQDMKCQTLISVESFSREGSTQHIRALPGKEMPHTVTSSEYNCPCESESKELKSWDSLWLFLGLQCYRTCNIHQASAVLCTMCHQHLLFHLVYSSYQSREVNEKVMKISKIPHSINEKKPG